MSRRRMIEMLAPVAPPCFDSRMQWLEYLVSAAEAQRLDHAPGPLIFEAGRPVRFDARFEFCADCDAAYSMAMVARGRCDPGHLQRLTLVEIVALAKSEGDNP